MRKICWLIDYTSFCIRLKDVTITGEELQKLRHLLHTYDLWREGSLSCHICCDTGPFFPLQFFWRTNQINLHSMTSKWNWGPILTRIPNTLNICTKTLQQKNWLKKTTPHINNTHFTPPHFFFFFWEGGGERGGGEESGNIDLIDKQWEYNNATLHSWQDVIMYLNNKFVVCN